MSAEDRVVELLGVAGKVMKFGDVFAPRGDKYTCLARVMIACQMRLDGYQIRLIAKALGRTPGTITKVTNDFTQTLSEFSLSYKYWKSFTDAVKEMDSERGDPVYSRFRKMTVGSLRKYLNDLPDSTIVKIYDTTRDGLIVRFTEE